MPWVAQRAGTLAGALSPGGHFVSYAWLSGSPIHLPQGDLIGKRLNIQGFWMYYERISAQDSPGAN